MSLAEIEKEVLALSEEERWQFVEWFYQNQGSIVPRDIDAAKGSATEAMKAELLQRKQEYLDHPERFRHVKTREELKEYFDEIRDEVRARLSSAR
jgi:hypothetical protein